MFSQVIVGYDGLREGERALRWGVNEARRRHLRLSVVHGWSWPYPENGDHSKALGLIRGTAERVLDQGVALAQELSPRTEVRRRLVEGPAASMIVHESLGAELIVLGANGHDEMPVGSTASRVAAHSSCPVIVVRDLGPGDGRIVIGFDGSEAGDAVLAFGFEEAALQGCRVMIVHGQGCGGPAAGGDQSRAVDMATRSTSAVIENLVAPWRAKYPYIDAKVSIVRESPRVALAEAARGAQMLVVGDRESDGFPAQLLGSTSQAMLQYAPCPVAVVHLQRRSAAAERMSVHVMGGGVPQ